MQRESGMKWRRLIGVLEYARICICMHACIRQPNYSFAHGWMDCCMDAYIYIIHVYSCVHVHSRTHRSLTTLGRVVALLAEGQQNALPWRESKLTRLLQHSLGTTVAL